MALPDHIPIYVFYTLQCCTSHRILIYYDMHFILRHFALCCWYWSEVRWSERNGIQYCSAVRPTWNFKCPKSKTLDKWVIYVLCVSCILATRHIYCQLNNAYDKKVHFCYCGATPPPSNPPFMRSDYT